MYVAKDDLELLNVPATTSQVTELLTRITMLSFHQESSFAPPPRVPPDSDALHVQLHSHCSISMEALFAHITDKALRPREGR